MRPTINKVLSTATAALAVFVLSTGDLAANNPEYKTHAKAGEFTLGQIKSVQRVTKKLKGAGNLLNQKIKNAKAGNNYLTGDVKLKNVDFKLSVYGDGKPKDTFVALTPKTAMKFSDLFGNHKGIKLIDALVPKHMTFIFAAADLDLTSENLPSEDHNFVGDLLLGKDYKHDEEFEFEAKQGANMVGSSDLSKSKILSDGIKAMGGKSGLVTFTATLSPNLLDALLDGQKPEPELALTATLPKFKPKLGKLAFPTDVDVALAATLTKSEAEMEVAGTVELDGLSKKGTKTPLAVKTVFKAEGSKIESELVGVLAEGKPLTHAFGVSWLTVEEYKLSVGTDGVGMAGKTSFGEKSFFLSASVTPTVPPVPTELAFAVDDGDDKIGELGFKDLINLINHIRKSEKKTEFPTGGVPDIAITGTEKGKGPEFELSIKDVAFSLAGAVKLFGTQVATIENASFDPSSGIDVTANMTELQLGPLKFPSGNLTLRAMADKEGREFTGPEAHILVKGFSLFNSKSEVFADMSVQNLKIGTNQDFGDLFKFNLAAGTTEEIKDLEHLKKLDLHLDASLQTDPAKWIKENGAKVVNATFGGLSKELDKAKADLKAAKKNEDDQSAKVQAARATVLAERNTTEQHIKNAQDHVNKINKDISDTNNQINNAQSKIKTCNQTYSVCTGWKVTSVIPWRSSCTGHKNVADWPARTVCAAGNAPHEAEKLTLQAKKTALQGSLTVAKETLKAVQAGLDAIPVDADPRVAAELVAYNTLRLSRIAAQEIVDGFSGLTKVVTSGTSAVSGNASGFKMKQGTIKGALSSVVGTNTAPVLLELSYELDGESKFTRLAFAPNDSAYNAKQFEVLVLNMAVRAMFKAAADSKIVPSSLIAKVHQLYADRVKLGQDEITKAAKNAGYEIHTSDHVHEPVKEIATQFKDTLEKKREAELKKKLAAENDRIKASNEAGNLATLLHLGTHGTLYGLKANGDLHYYIHDEHGKFSVSGKKIGWGFNKFSRLLAGRPGTLYGLQPNGDLLLYRHNEKGNFTVLGKKIGEGWQQFSQVIAGADDTLYALKGNDLLYYRHDSNGSFHVNGKKLGAGWASLAKKGVLFPGSHDTVFAIEYPQAADPDTRKTCTQVWSKKFSLPGDIKKLKSQLQEQEKKAKSNPLNAAKEMAKLAPLQAQIGKESATLQANNAVWSARCNDKLILYTHDGNGDNMAGPVTAGSGWSQFRLVAGGRNGAVYGVSPEGLLKFYRYDVHGNRWLTQNQRIGEGWQQFKDVIATID